MNLSSPLGRPIRVGVFEHDPDAFNCFRQVPKKPCKQPGAEIEIISSVMQILQWDWEVVDTQQDFGVVNDFGSLQPDGNFSGVMGLLSRNEIDMSGLSMRITPDRMKAAHFTFPVRYFQQVYIVNTPPDADFKTFIFTSVSQKLWIYLLITFALVGLIKFSIGILLERRPIPKTNLFSGCFLESFGLMIKQRIAKPTTASMKILEVFLIASMMFVGQYYQTEMNSKLTAPPKAKIPFLHQDELLDRFERGENYPTYYLDVPLEGSTPENQLRIDAYWAENRLKIHPREEDIVEEIHKGGVFYSTYDVDLTPNVLSVWNRKERLTVIRDTTGVVSYVAFGFSWNNRRLCSQFNKALMLLLPGVPKMTVGPGYARVREPLEQNVEVRHTTLTLKCHLEQLFIILVICLLVSFFCFVVELLIHRSQRLFIAYLVVSFNGRLAQGVLGDRVPQRNF